MSGSIASFERASLPEDFELVLDRSIAPEEIIKVRQEETTPENIEEWRACLEESYHVVGVREISTQTLVGIGMIAGNQRHAELVDGTVHPDFRRRGIGRVLLSERIAHVREKKVKYVGLTYDESSPWLKEYYERYGFQSIGFGMWLLDSLEAKNKPTS